MRPVVIRPLQETDVAAAVDVALEALPIPADHEEGERPAWIGNRMRRFIETDPGGAWVAEDDTMVVGVATALVRDGIWGLSLMAVQPDQHARRAGTQLLRATLSYAQGARGGLIASSTDPRAMRLYARAGFDLRPCVALAGLLDHDAMPGGLRAQPSGDVEQAAALSKPIRGGAYDPADLQLYLDRPGAAMVLIDGRGFAIHREGSPFALAARDDEAAADLLWSCFTGAPRGGTVHVDFLTAGQDWAVRTGLQAGLVLSPDGPLYTRGELGPLRPWVPSGAVL